MPPEPNPNRSNEATLRICSTLRNDQTLPFYGHLQGCSFNGAISPNPGIGLAHPSGLIGAVSPKHPNPLVQFRSLTAQKRCHGSNIWVYTGHVIFVLDAYQDTYEVGPSEPNRRKSLSGFERRDASIPQLSDLQGEIGAWFRFPLCVFCLCFNDRLFRDLIVGHLDLSLFPPTCHFAGLRQKNLGVLSGRADSTPKLQAWLLFGTGLEGKLEERAPAVSAFVPTFGNCSMVVL